MTPGRCSRAARAAMFAAVCVLLAAVGHVLMSGRALSTGTLAVSFAGTALGAWGLAGRERGLLAVTAAATAFQTALHTVFSWSQSAGAAPGGSGCPAHAAGHLGMAHHAPPSPTGHDMTAASSSLPETVTEAVTEAVTGAVTGPMAGMTAAHALAALLGGMWLAYGERAAFRLLRAVPAALFRPLRLLLATAAAPPVRSRIRPVRPGDEPAPRQLLHASRTLPTRGPPRAVAVVRQQAPRLRGVPHGP
ncbi:hypothetical protein [Streptomyces sp. NPDC050504]|uniref:hypothetical protein n=1 Tax=Streptomyces sp. NPDC050504 TaxID=3365618 RepID=UPI00379D323B